MERRISRRKLLVTGSALSCAGATEFLRAHTAEAAGPAGSAASFELDTATAGATPRRMHVGKGTIDVKFFFEPQRPAQPALLLQYDIPPGASEGVHTHAVGRPEGPWDEFYYIVSGAGRMTIDGRHVPVKAGDNVHTPLGAAHGIENTSTDEHLHVYLVAINRG